MCLIALGLSSNGKRRKRRSVARISTEQLPNCTRNLFFSHARLHVQLNESAAAQARKTLETTP